MASTSNCSSCGGQVAPRAKFCRHCGAALEATEVGSASPAVEGAEPKSGICPACSAPVPLGAAFCRSCGERLPGAAKPEGPRQTPVLPQPSKTSRGPSLALAAVAACLALGGVVFGGVYLLVRDDSGAEEQTGPITEPWPIPDPPDGESSNGSRPTERGFPTDSKPAMRAEAEELLREYHVALVEGEFQYAWSLLSSRKRQQEEQEQGFSGWKEAQATLTPYLLPDGIHVEIDELKAKELQGCW